MLHSPTGRRPSLAGLERAAQRAARWSSRRQALAIAGACILLAAVLVLVLVLPGKTYSAVYAHDMMIFFDGAHRVLAGQLPNREFHTPLGLLAYLLPAAGVWLSGSMGGMMPLATALFVLAFLPMLIHVCVTRLPLAYAAIFAFFALALVVTPASIGESLPSFGMFYNRWGYALLAVLFLLVLPPIRGGPRPWVDALVAGAALFTSFYLKISYFAVALGFTILLLVFRDTRRSALMAIAIAAVGILLVHLVWGGTASYLADIGTAARVTGAVRASVLGLVRMALDNAGMIVPFLIVLALAIARGISFQTLFLCLVMAGAGLLLYNQNFQGPGIMTLVPAAIVAALAPGGAAQQRTAPRSLQLPALLVTAALALPPAILAAQSILLHSWMAARGGDPQEYVAEVDRFMAQEVARPEQGQAGFANFRDAYRAGVADLKQLKLLRNQALRQVLAQPEYLWTIQDGARLLSDPRLAGPVFTLDMANPFNAVTGRPAPAGVDSWYHAGRSFNETTFREPEQLFADVAVVMVPKAPVEPRSHLLLERMYGGYLAKNYDLAATSDYWLAYRRKQPARPS